MILLLSWLAVAQVVPQYPVTVLSCWDGDTCTIDLTLAAPLPGWNFSVMIQLHESTRFCGINAPELKGTTAEAAKVSRDYLLSRIRAGKSLEWRVYLKNQQVQRDKYGRLLGWLLVDGVDMNAELVARGYAAAYALDCT